MLILALDTSGKSLSAALVRDGELLGEATLAIGLRHSATALPLVHDLCSRCGTDYASVDAYACAIGPGSYTGIRIGVSLIKGMAYAAGKPAVGISSLDALAAGLGPVAGAIVLPLLDARSGRLFCSAQRDGQVVLPAGNRQQRQLAAELEPHLRALAPGQRRLILVGDGAAAYSDPAVWPGAEQVLDAGMAFRWPRAAVVGLLAGRRLDLGGDFSPFRLDADYVSPSQAERLRQAGFRIRPARKEDLPVLAELEQRCFAIPWSEAALSAELADQEKARVLVAETETGAVIGYVSSWFILGEAEIHNIAVDPAHRRRGVGRALLGALLAAGESERIESFTLEVRPSNDEALGLYRSFGFEDCGHRVGYYENNQEDAIIMRKNIINYQK